MSRTLHSLLSSLKTFALLLCVFEATASADDSYTYLTTSLNGTSFNSVASDASGQTMVATRDSLPIFLIHGQSFSPAISSGFRNWTGVTISADGTKIVGVVSSGGIYTSSDGGENWTPHTQYTLGPLAKVASSADGQRIAVASSDGKLILSKDAGTTWSEATRLTHETWLSIAVSADGRHLLLGSDNGALYVSHDYGETWKAGEILKSWTTVASSSSGRYLVAAGSTGYVFTSDDFGASWVERQNSPGQNDYTAVAISGKGDRIIALATDRRIAISDDFGSTWSEEFSSGLRNWLAIGAAVDTNQIVASTADNQLVISSGSSVTAVSSYLYTPLADQINSRFSPYVYWKAGATDCSYSYDGNTFTTANCALAGADILPPDERGTKTLYLKTDDDTLSTTFQYDGPTITFNTPADYANISRLTDFKINFGSASVCSYALGTEDPVVIDCANQGSDITPTVPLIRPREHWFFT